jgi:hypothetical protein
MSELTQTSPTRTVDVNVPRFNQSVVAVLTALAFAIDRPWIVAFAAIILTLSAFGPPWLAALSRLYVTLVRPLVDPDGPTEFEPAAPPRFAQRIGAGFLVAATAMFVAGFPLVAWSLTLIVTALAALAATTRICVGCILYERVVGA